MFRQQNLLQNTYGEMIMTKEKPFIFNTLFPALLKQDNAIESHKCRICTCKTAV